MLDSSQVSRNVVNIGGVEVEYFTRGEDTGRAPLVMIHGTAGSVESHFGYLFPMLAHRQQVVAMNLADPSGALEIDALVDQVQAVIDASVPGQRITLLGYSLGAVVAAAAAARLGARVENLILVAGWMKTDTHQVLRNGIWSSLRAEDSSALQKFMLLCALSPAFMASRPADDMRKIAKMLVVNPFTERQMALNARIDITDCVDAIVARTLVIGCSSDFMVPVRHSKMLFGAIADARYTEIASGHGVTIERPAELFRAVDTFTRNPTAYPSGAIIAAQKP
jgi:pimeloyl-ACP methyl ester carboxylesterase